MDCKDLKNLGHSFLLLLAVVGHLSQHHLQKRENQGEGWRGQGRSVCESKKQTDTSENSNGGFEPSSGQAGARRLEALSDTLKPAA